MKRLVRKKERARTDRLKVANNKYTADRGGPESRALQSPSKWVFHTGRKDISFHYLGEISLENIKCEMHAKARELFAPGHRPSFFCAVSPHFSTREEGKNFTSDLRQKSHKSEDLSGLCKTPSSSPSCS